MAGEMETLFSLAGRMHVLLRREANRIVDVEWLTANADYARETIRIARTTESGELHALAARIAEVHPLLGRSEPAGGHTSEKAAPAGPEKYVRTLR